MTDPKRRNVWPSESGFHRPSPAAPDEAASAIPSVRAIRTSAAAPQAPADPGVQVRPVRRPAGSGGESSLEALSGLDTRPERPAQTAAHVRAVRRPPTPAELRRPEPVAPPPATPLATAPAPAEEPSDTPAPAPQSGWLNYALSDWLQEPSGHTKTPQAAAPQPQTPPPAAPKLPSVRQIVGADANDEAAPASLPRQVPLTLQEALASDLLPDLPVELLERLWQQEQAALAPQPAAEAVQTTPASPASPPPQQALSAMPAGPHVVVPHLEPMFPGVSPFLARFLPLSAPQQMGLNARFCDLHAFLKYLHDLGWYGYLHVAMGDLSTYALVYEGRVVAAAAVNATGEQALGELLSLYEQGATMATYPLPPTYAHVLSGVGSRAWKFDLTEDFTGLYADPEGALFYSRGEVVATMPAGLPYEGAFPAPLRPQTLILPRSFAGWAHQLYVLTLRGRDANNPITGVYHEFRSKYGEAAAQFIRALGEKQTPADYAVKTDAALHDLEAMLLEFAQGGYIKEQGH